GSNTCAEEWSGFSGIKLIRNGSDASGFRDHHLRISSIDGYSGHDRVLAINGVSASARFAHSVFARDEADTDALADFPSGYSGTQGVDPANYLVAGNAWQG